MNRNLGLAGLFLVCAVMNMLNVFLTKSGIGILLGIAWLAASMMMYIRYRKEKNAEQEDEK